MAIRMSGLVSQLDTDSIIKELMSAQSLKKTSIENKQTKLEWKQDIWKELNTKIYKFYTDSVSKMRLQGSYKAKTVSSADEGIATATASTTAATGTHTLEVTQLASSQYVTGAPKTGITTTTKLADKSIAAGTVITFSSGTGSNKVTKTLNVTTDTTVANFLSTAQKAGLNASYDKTQGRFFISSGESGVANNFSITSTASLSSIGLMNIDPSSTTMAADATAAGISYVPASDASIKLDGAVLTGSSNNFTAAGITFSLKDKTAGQPIKISVTDDTQANYDMVKDFISDYNTLLKEMNELYDAASAKGYDPLTDDQKESMTDDQIEKWETKIKDSLLRRDDKLGTLINSMKSSLAKSVSIDKKSYNLSTYGIMTSSDYTEKGLLHIYGDTDDSTYADKPDKLKTALQEDPSKVAEALAGMAQNLYSTMTDKMKTSSINSAFTFYNDKQIKNQLSDYEDDVDEWEDRLTDIEDRYYKQFTAMEKALSSLNTQSSYLSGLMGTSQ